MNTELTWSPTVKAKGRNHFNSDALNVALEKEGDKYFVYIENRVASTGLYNMGFCCIPADSKLLGDLADHLLAIACKL